jgi:hypothetical protein
MTLEEMEAGLRARPEALLPAARAERRHVLVHPDFDRAGAIGTFKGALGDPYLRGTLELEEDKRRRLLMEMERK